MRRVIESQSFEETGITREAALALYRDIVRTRLFDERAISLQRQGKISGYPPYRGQEASQVGVAHALAESDLLVPTYRSNAIQIARGVPMSDILLFRRGHAEFDSDHDIPIFPQAVPIATQLPHAVGAGMASDYQNDDHATCVYFGDGATSEGDFHEALNFAGVFDAPVVFFCENNGWAISMPSERQTASTTIAQKARAYGFEGVRVDGNDPIAVKEVVEESLAKARDNIPILVESLTYRQGAHSTSDDPSRYRDDPESLPAWRRTDPLDRFERYLRDHRLLDDDRADAIRTAAEAELDESIEKVENTADPDHDELFDHVFAKSTGRIESQRAESKHAESLRREERQ